MYHKLGYELICGQTWRIPTPPMFCRPHAGATQESSTLNPKLFEALNGGLCPHVSHLPACMRSLLHRESRSFWLSSASTTTTGVSRMQARHSLDAMAAHLTVLDKH